MSDVAADSTVADATAELLLHPYRGLKPTAKFRAPLRGVGEMTKTILTTQGAATRQEEMTNLTVGLLTRQPPPRRVQTLTPSECDASRRRPRDASGRAGAARRCSTRSGSAPGVRSRRSRGRRVERPLRCHA